MGSIHRRTAAGDAGPEGPTLLSEAPPGHVEQQSQRANGGKGRPILEAGAVGVACYRQGAPSAGPSWSSGTISLILAIGDWVCRHWRKR